MDSKKIEPNQGMEVSVNPDATPIVYTDNVQIVANEDGVVLDIGQRLGATNQIRIVSRVGMSREHAKKLTKALQDALDSSSGQTQTGKVARA